MNAAHALIGAAIGIGVIVIAGLYSWFIIAMTNRSVAHNWSTPRLLLIALAPACTLIIGVFTLKAATL